MRFFSFTRCSAFEAEERFWIISQAPPVKRTPDSPKPQTPLSSEEEVLTAPAYLLWPQGVW